MRRFSIFVLVALVGVPLFGQGNWYAPYQSAMTAVEKEQWPVAASELAKAISIEPNENSVALHRNRKVEYLPYYWLGVVRQALGDADAALAAWKKSEEQGQVQKTSRYTDLRRRLSAVESERRQAVGAASSSVRADADRALQDALSAQMAAVGAGADRHADFKSGQQKLQDALKVINGAGTNVSEIERGTGMADEARALFGKAMTSKQSTTGPPARKTPTKDPEIKPVKEIENDPVQALVKEIEVKPVLESVPGPPGELDVVGGPPPVQIPSEESEVLRPGSTDGVKGIRTEAEPVRTDGELIRRAWAHYSSGDVDAAEALLSALIDTGRGSAESHLLRGCALFTRAMMRNEKNLLEYVRGDFIEALRRNPELSIEADHFSPRLVEYFNVVRRELVGQS